MSAHRKPGLSRHRFLNAAAGTGAAAAGLTACTSSGPAPPAATGRGLADLVLEAFKTHRLVALGAADSPQTHYDVLGLLLTDPRLPGVVGDIIVEWGNALYHDTVDKFIAGQPVADAGLRPAWRTTTQSPLETWDAPVCEQFYRMARAVNWALPPGQRIRVLAGDSPLDWAKITKPGQLRAVPPRGPFVASLVQQQVLAREPPCAVVLRHDRPVPRQWHDRRDRATDRPADLRDRRLGAAGRDPGGLARRLSRYPRDTVIPAAGTWLGSFKSGLFAAEARPGGKNPFCGVRLGSLIDAGLYPGQPGVLTATWPDPDIYFSPVLGRTTAPQRPHRQRPRPGQLRQERPPGYPLTPLPPPRRCAQNEQAGT